MIEQLVRIRLQGGGVQRGCRRADSPIATSLREDVAGGATYHEVSDPDGGWPRRDAVEIGEAFEPSEMTGLAAPTSPTKIVCVGRNYRRHAEELGNEIPEEPLIFLKPPSAVIGHGRAIERPLDSEDVQHEAELALVVGRRCRHVDAGRADQVIAGVTAANDVTARDLQRKDKLFTRGKGFDSFCPIGPAVTPTGAWVTVGEDEEEWPTGEKGVSCEVNGEIRQRGVFSDFIFSIGDVVAYISRIMTLEPGDVILTGTPSGVGTLEGGDEVEVTVDGVGTLSNGVR